MEVDDLVAICALLVPFLMAADPGITIQGAARHPTVYVTPEDVARARHRIEHDPEARAWLESLQRSAAVWSDKTPAWIREVLPRPGACFAYGFTGCPICGSTWGTWGEAKASFDNPGHVKCAQGHVLPDRSFPDVGEGYIGDDKRIHYFVGSYNAWVVETLTQKIARPYATIYLLSGDERAGRMAAVILDEIARIYPSCDKGSWDYPSNPPSGRLNRPWYQVARVLVHYVDIYDRIHDHPALDEVSSVQGLTRRQNIEKNLLLNGASYCREMSAKGTRLHNGEADYLRGVLSVGIALGIPEYITWPVDGPCGIRTMLANNIDRDGQYYETSTLYSLHARGLYLTFAEPLLNYRGPLFPNGLNLYDDPRIESSLVLPQLSMVCLGHDPPIGDDAPETTRRSPPFRPPKTIDRVYTEYLANRVSDPRKRAEYAALLRYLAVGDVSPTEHGGDLTEWRVFHASSRPAEEAGALSDHLKQRMDGSFFFGQKGIAVMRQGEGDRAHAAVFRFGPSLNHGHCDDLNVNYFARGYELTYDIGYSLGSTHTQVGWARQTVSHDVVVVDEKSQGGGSSGGSLFHFLASPDLVLADASSTAYAHVGVDVYRRMLALSDQYALDVFRVRGGRQHDFPLHSLTADMAFEGLTFDPVRPGSLAGEKYRWGELQLNDGDMKGYPNKPYWNPPPGNGYGFLVQPRSAMPKGDWSASWRLSDSDHVRLGLLPLPDAGVEVISALAPGLYPRLPKAGYLVRRRSGVDLSSCFVSLWQSSMGGGSFPVLSIRRVDSDGPLSADAAFAVAVELTAGQRDLWMIAPDSNARLTARQGEAPFAFQGAIAWCRLDGDELLSAHLLDAKSLQVAGWTIVLDSPDRSAAVARLPDGSASLQLDTAWPTDGRYQGDALYVSSPRYSRGSGYTVRAVEGDNVQLEQADTILGRGVVDSVPDSHTLISRSPHEYACCMGNAQSSSFFQGKLLRTEDGSAATNIRSVALGKTLQIKVDSTAGFKVGQGFRYHDVQPRDTVSVQHHATLVRLAPRSYRLSANTDVIVQVPPPAKVRFLDAAGHEQSAADGRISREALPRSGQTVLTFSD